jgi:hypothetical protein
MARWPVPLGVVTVCAGTLLSAWRYVAFFKLLNNGTSPAELTGCISTIWGSALCAVIATIGTLIVSARTSKHLPITNRLRVPVIVGCATVMTCYLAVRIVLSIFV